MLELAEERQASRGWRARGKPRPARRRLLVSVFHIRAGLRCTRSLLPDETALCVGLRGRQLLAVASSTPLAILRTLAEMSLLSIETAVVAGPSLAMDAAGCGRLRVPLAGIAWSELAVRVCICRADHSCAVNATYKLGTLRQFGLDHMN